MRIASAVPWVKNHSVPSSDSLFAESLRRMLFPPDMDQTVLKAERPHFRIVILKLKDIHVLLSKEFPAKLQQFQFVVSRWI